MGLLHQETDKKTSGFELSIVNLLLQYCKIIINNKCTYFKKRFISIHRPSRIMFFFQQIMRYFLANYAPKIPDYANFKHKFLLFQFNKLANLLWFYSEYKFIHF